MKKIIFAFAILIAVFGILLSISILNSEENAKRNMQISAGSDPEEFLVGAYSIGCASQNRLQQLGLNMWHRFLNQETLTVQGYKQRSYPIGFDTSDHLFNTINNYQTGTTNYYNSVSQLNNNYLYLTRPKIEMLTFAQRSDYHPFAINVHQLSEKGNWWYGYADHDTNVAVDTIDNNGTNVKYSKQGVKIAGYVLSGLRPTWEQVKGQVPNNFFADSIYSWYIKPSVKIPRVCRLAYLFGTKNDGC